MSLYTKSLKISKKHRNSVLGMRSFACGGCSKTYKSYPALYLHIKRKHNGIKPPNTVTMKSLDSPNEAPVQTGRPHKPSYNIDNVSTVETELEVVQNSLFHLLGDKMHVIEDFEPKVKMEDVMNKIREAAQGKDDKYITTLLAKSEEYYNDFKARFPQGLEIKLDTEPELIGSEDDLKCLAWYVIWLGKFYLKPKFVPDLFILVSKIWKVLDEFKLNIRDLDNKIIWKKVLIESDFLKENNEFLKNEPTQISFLIQIVCQMIDKIFLQFSDYPE